MANFLDNEGLIKYHAKLVELVKSLAGVESFNGRNGIVMPQDGDYNAFMVGAVPDTRQINGKRLNADITITKDDIEGLDALTPDLSGYVPTSRKINNKALTSDITLSASDVSAVPTSRTVNGKALSSNVTITKDDIEGLDLLGVGQSMAGKTVYTEKDAAAVIADEGSEIFNDYRVRTFGSTFASAGNVASGAFSHAEGQATTAIGAFAHAEGLSTVASANYSHTEGVGSIASGKGAHTEGDHTTASGISSHAEGYNTTASGDYSHAEGNETKASELCSHAEGSLNGAIGRYCHAEGYNTTASGDYSHTEGCMTMALGNDSHSEGRETTAGGDHSHAEGYSTYAYGVYSHAGGYHTQAWAAGQTAIGAWNVKNENSTDRFIIGNGTTNTALSNCFRVTNTGTYASGSYNSSGADYAEFFEWFDGNVNDEKRLGLFVTLDGEYIRLANSNDDFILGIVSGNPSVVGDVYDDQWQGMYLYDIYGQPLWEDVEVPDETMEIPDPENPEKTIKRVIIPAHTEHRQKLNPNYDHTQTYIPRSQRKEWACVGMMGKLVVQDDGTSQVNGYVKVGENGKATASETKTIYRVMKRIDEEHIKVLILANN